MDQGDVVHWLALLTEERYKLQVALKHQCKENNTLQAMITLYKEKKAVAATTMGAEGITPPPGFGSRRMMAAIQQLMVMASAMGIKNPFIEEVTQKPWGSLSPDPSWDDIIMTKEEHFNCKHEKAEHKGAEACNRAGQERR